MTTDRTALSQVCANLLANAVQHGLPEQEITVFSQRDPQPRICISNACGTIDDADLERLKERFFQADTARAQTGRNAGLGLTIADQLTRQLGGALTLELRDKNQFTATIFLPKKDPLSEMVWVAAINDPNLSPNSRRNLIDLVNSGQPGHLET